MGLGGRCGCRGLLRAARRQYLPALLRSSVSQLHWGAVPVRAGRHRPDRDLLFGLSPDWSVAGAARVIDRALPHRGELLCGGIARAGGRAVLTVPASPRTEERDRK